ncbi:MAG: murein biosynthesis integral membrane protein MurJ [Syntrophomonadaceae bacterium]|nr:murein biosynthesis integral membrane protein MurJ [Syntrophomonadaceae bacterium]
MAGKKTIAKVAGMLMVTMFLARVLGYVRDMVIYSSFGQTYITDAYNAAFSIPDFIYMLLVGGALSSALIPVLSGYFAQDDKEEGWKLVSLVLNWGIILLIILIGLGLIFTRPLILLLVPKLPPETISLAVTLTKVMLFQSFFMALNGISMGILNTRQHFTMPAVGGILYNLAIITIGLLMMEHWGIMAFSVGVVVGSALNFAIQVPALKRVGFVYYPTLNPNHPGLKQILLLMLPIMIGLSVTQVNLFVNQNLASGLAEGSISALRLAQRIMQLPIGIFGVSVAMAVFPTMTEQVAKNNIGEFKRLFSLGLRAVFIITIPAALGLMALREPLIELLFQHGQFDAEHTLATSQALFFYCFGLFAYSALQLANRIFYSLKDTVTPVVTGLAAIGLNIVLSILLVRVMSHQGLALAYSIAGVFNLVLLILLAKKRMGQIGGGRLMLSFLVACLASGLMYIGVRLGINVITPWLTFTPKLNAFIIVMAGTSLGTIIYGIIISVFRLEETQLVLALFKNRLPGIRFRV